MNRYLGFTIVSVLLLAASAGCRGQVPSNPTVYSCPASTGTAYAPLNQSTPTTSLTYSDKPGAGQFCYIAQSVAGTQVSLPSNTAGPLVTTSTNTVSLSWQAPTTGVTPTGYVISRAPAIATTINAPALGNGTVAIVKPALPTGLEQPKLVASLR